MNIFILILMPNFTDESLILMRRIATIATPGWGADKINDPCYNT
ncbi:hypothetical protein NC99_10510 [Sunxiuqinia dokdonensis]|uniref:Uncharacterized protein n=1 Tax=Sunxiuqinia dokdonensis TaxID=1409788 RepID=A0A0L8VCH1_9BACT|nr:hypothetical protein NC99_10510 [Sunxiuqinia dokdonensis]